MDTVKIYNAYLRAYETLDPQLDVLERNLYLTFLDDLVDYGNDVPALVREYERARDLSAANDSPVEKDTYDEFLYSLRRIAVEGEVGL